MSPISSDGPSSQIRDETVAGLGKKVSFVMDQGLRQISGPARQPIAIVLSRLPGVESRPGLISFLIDTGATRPAGRLGMLTDAALRSRLAFFDAHSANEIAAIRKALAADYGRTIIYEEWPELQSCVRFWYGLVGSKIRPIESACEFCGKQDRGSVGGSIGETFLRLCGCGRASWITVSNPLPAGIPPAIPKKNRGTGWSPEDSNTSSDLQ